MIKLIRLFQAKADLALEKLSILRAQNQMPSPEAFARLEAEHETWQKAANLARKMELGR